MRAIRITRPPLKESISRFPQREFHIRERLRSMGHEVSQYEIRPAPIRNTYLSYGIGALLSVVRFRREKADVIVADNIEAATVALILRIVYGVPFVFDFIDDYSLIAGYDTFRLRCRFIRLLERRLPKWADLVIVVDEHKRLFCEKIGVRSEKIIVIPDGTDMEKFRPDVPPAEGVANHQFGDQSIVLYVGKMNSYYSVELLIDAMPVVLERFPHTKFILVGDGNNMEQLHKRCEDLSVDHAALFTGFLSPEKIPSLITRADVCLFPLPDSSALAIFEYMACGKPVVIPDYSTEKMGISGDVLPDDSIVKAPHSPGGIAGKIISLLKDGQLREEIGKRARRCVETLYDWDVLASKYEAALRRAVALKE
jgi:glycosyltransferase involved in cell wall biosynthesis